MGQARLTHFGEIVRQLWQTRNTLADLRHQDGEFGQGHERPAILEQSDG